MFLTLKLCFIFSWLRFFRIIAYYSVPCIPFNLTTSPCSASRSVQHTVQLDPTNLSSVILNSLLFWTHAKPFSMDLPFSHFLSAISHYCYFTCFPWEFDTVGFNQGRAGAYPDFRGMKQLKEYFCSPLDGMLFHCRVTPSIKFAGTHLYTWVERGTIWE